MTEQIQAYMQEYHMVNAGDTVLAGVSGGADSVCLLLVLLELRERLKFSVRVIHVEHGIRGASARRDEAFVEALCKEKDVPYVCYHYDVPQLAREKGVSLEEMGRNLRYEAFAEEAAKCEPCKIAVAHNQNDNAETMLHNLVRGAYAAGLSGIAPVRGNIIRPLLGVSRQEIEQYLTKHKQGYCTDETNTELVYTRNRIRHEVLPILTQINPAAVAHMARTAEHLREMQGYVMEQTAQVEQNVVEWQSGAAHIKTEKLQNVPKLLQTQLFYEIVTRLAGSRKDITEVHMEALMGLQEKQVGRELTLPYGLKAVREYEGICITAVQPETDRQERDREEPLSESGDFSTEVTECSGIWKEIPKKKYTKWFDYDKIKDNLCVRSRRAGDYFRLEDGRTKKLKQYFIDEKIPKEQRNRILLVADGSHIVWIVGYRISAYYKVTEHTRRIIKVQYEDGGRKEDE